MSATIAATLIRSARLEAGITLAELARRAGTSAPTISRYENGLVDPRSETLARLLRACGVELRAEPIGLPHSLDDVRRRFSGQPAPTVDDVTRTTDGRELRTADDLIAFTAELRSDGPRRRKLMFAAADASTSGRTAADAEELLEEGGFGISADR